MMRTIIQYEFKQLLRNGSFWGMLIALLASGGFAIIYGWQNYQNLFQQIAAVQEKEKEVRAELLAQYDTLNRLGNAAPTELRQNLSNPIQVDWRYRRYATWLPEPLSALAIGQLDQQTPYQRIQFYRSIHQPELEEINNPELLLAGNFDLAFVLVYLLPLCIIILGFNALSQDQETGRLALLSAQGVTLKQLLLARIGLQFFLLWAIVSGLITIGFALVGAHWRWWPIWMIGTGLWLGWWAVVVAWVNSWRQSSALNAIVLAGAWIALLILIPAAVNFWLDKAHPILTRSGFMAKARDLDYQDWDRPNQDLFADFYRLRPDLNSYLSKPIKDTAAIKIYLFTAVNMAKIDQMGEPIQRNRLQRLALEDRLKFGNPTFTYHTLLTTSAGTELRNFLAWQDHTQQLLQKNRNVVLKAGLEGRAFSKPDFDQLVRAAAGPTTGYAGNQLLTLAILVAVSGLLVYVFALRQIH